MERMMTKKKLYKRAKAAVRDVEYILSFIPALKMFGVNVRVYYHSELDAVDVTLDNPAEEDCSKSYYFGVGKNKLNEDQRTECFRDLRTIWGATNERMDNKI